MLLKTLEESSANVLFILITHKPHFLLPTILSRCWEIKFSPINEAEITSYLIKTFQVTEETAQKLIQVYSTNISNIVDSILNDQELEDSPIIFFFRHIWKTEYYTAMQLVNDYTNSNDKVKALLLMERFQGMCLRLLEAKINSGNLSGEIVNLARSLDSDGINEISKYCIDSAKLINSNINMNLIWTNLFIKIKKSFIT